MSVQNFFLRQPSLDNEDPLESPQPNVADPLLEERALVMTGNDYVNGAHMTRERIDQVIQKMKNDGQIPDIPINKYLSRLALRSILKPVYQPFHDYLHEDVYGGREPSRIFRHGRNPDDAYYQGLHEYLMEDNHHVTEEDVLKYVQLRKKNRQNVEGYENLRHYHLYGKGNGFRYPKESFVNPMTEPLSYRMHGPNRPYSN